MNKHQETFVNAMATHGDPVQAYLTAYPNASPASARAAAYRLLRQPEIKKAVDFDKSIIDKKAKSAALHAGKARRKKELATIEGKREVLAAMIDGSFMRRRVIKMKDELLTVYEDIPSMSVLRAIELDCKLEAGYVWHNRSAIAGKEAAREEKQKAGPLHPVHADAKDITAAMVLIGAVPFDPARDMHWLNRYIAWKEQNPAKVKEWYIAGTIRTDTYVQWDEDTEGFPGSPKQREGSTTLVQIARFHDSGYTGPFIPGHSEIVLPQSANEKTAKAVPPSDGQSIKTSLPSGGGGGNNTVPPLDRQPIKTSLPSGGDGSKQHPLPSGGEAGEHTTVFLRNEKHNSEQLVTMQPASTPQQAGGIIKTEQVKTPADCRWEAYKQLNTIYPTLPPRMQAAKEKWFRGLNAENQEAHLRPLREWKKKNEAA